MLYVRLYVHCYTLYTRLRSDNNNILCSIGRFRTVDGFKRERVLFFFFVDKITKSVSNNV
jgi:hypothetical protein